MIYTISSSCLIILFSTIIGVILKTKQLISTLSILLLAFFCLGAVFAFPYLYANMNIFLTLVVLLGSGLCFAILLPLIDNKFFMPYIYSVDRRKRRMEHLYTRGQHLYAYPLDDEDDTPSSTNTNTSEDDDAELLQEALEVEEAINSLSTDTTIDWNTIGDINDTDNDTATINSSNNVPTEDMSEVASDDNQSEKEKREITSEHIHSDNQEEQEEFEDMSIDWLLDGISQDEKN